MLGSGNPIGGSGSPIDVVVGAIARCAEAAAALPRTSTITSTVRIGLAYRVSPSSDVLELLRFSNARVVAPDLF
jgi:hypothetical protein